MHWLEFDWRYSWISQVLVALDRALTTLVADFDDGLDLLEHAESLIGVAYVAIQTYISGTVADLTEMFPGCPKAPELLRSESPVVSNADITYVESIWAAANYFKHHDEWRDWEPDANRHNRHTLSALNKLGISAATEFPCSVILQRLQGNEWRLERILDVATCWRESWSAKLTMGSDTDGN